ncbi:hypothetical protein FRX31_010231 [Thalictrum thalictroides]|uniref:Protein kinase domain-containing protein n=1 Tax=Thalictrum thalictroides TaxID=46969 RepID=A0A7J6WVT1_THATH|nr:hypothetical protein FRX31_010231 [Thalictrum thalictroides]
MMKIFDVNNYNVGTEIPSNSDHVKLYKAKLKVEQAPPLVIKSVFTNLWGSFQGCRRSDLNHKNILPYVLFNQNQVNYVVMPFMGMGSIQDILPNLLEGLREKEVACLIKEALNGLQYLHSNGWLHKGVKPSNILLDYRKVAGIRLSFSFNPQSSSSLTVPPFFRKVDVPYWIPPESRQHYYYSNIQNVSKWPPQKTDEPCDPELLKSDICGSCDGNGSYGIRGSGCDGDKMAVVARLMHSGVLVDAVALEEVVFVMVAAIVRILTVG